MPAMAGYELGRNYKHWQDDGCEISPSCLSCPLEVCKYDQPATRRDPSPESIEALKQKRLATFHRIVEMRRAGKTWEVIAAELHISRRSVAAALREVPPPATDMQPALPLWGEAN